MVKIKMAVTAATLWLGSLLVATQAQTWQDLSANPPGMLTSEQFAPMASDGARLYVLGAKGIFVSSDNGASFSAINTVAGEMPDLVQQSLRMVKFVNGEVWISGTGVIDQPGVLGARLHRLTPGETVWRPSSAGIQASAGVVDDIVFDPASGKYFTTHSTGEVFVSADNGATWTSQTPEGIGSPSSIIAQNGAVLTSRPLAGIVRTTSHGANWTSAYRTGSDSIGTLINHAGRALLVSERKVVFSDDAGLTWTTIPGAPHGASVVKSDGEIIYAISRVNSAPEVMAYSASGGVGWQILTREGIPARGQFEWAGYYAKSLFPHGGYLFLLGETLNASFETENTQLHRLELRSFTFLNPLEIAVQPEGRGLLVGQSHVLEVYASGNNLSYQWRKDGVDIPGASGRTFQLSQVQLQDEGAYTVVMTSGADHVTSDAAQVQVFVREDGRFDPVFDQTDLSAGGKVHLLPDGSAIVVRTGGTQLEIYRMGPEGGRGAYFRQTSSTANSLSVSLLDKDGRIVAAYKPTSNTTVLRRYDPHTFEMLSNLILGPNSSMERVQDMIEVPGKGYLLVGVFATAGGVDRKNIALIDYENNVVPDFPPGPGPDSSLDGVTLAPDGSIYVVGSTLSKWNDVNTLGIARIDKNGNVHPVTTGLPNPGAFNFVHALKDGRLIVRYTHANSPRLYALYPGIGLDETFTAAGQTLAVLQAIAEQADGKLVLVGNFTTFGGTAAPGYVRLHPNGTVDESFYNETGFSSGVIDNVAYDPRGYLYLSVGGGSASSTFQGFPLGGRGPVRIFAHPASTNNPPIDPPAGGYSDWAAGFNLPSGVSGPSADASGDGIANLVVYALGGNPLEDNTTRLPASIEIIHDGQVYPGLTFTRNKLAEEITIEVTASDGVTFAVPSEYIEMVKELGNNLERVTIRATEPLPNITTFFFSVKVSAD